MGETKVIVPTPDDNPKLRAAIREAYRCIAAGEPPRSGDYFIASAHSNPVRVVEDYIVALYTVDPPSGEDVNG